MFSKSKSSEPVNITKTQDSTTLISSDTAIQGNVKFTGVMHLEGAVQGNITSEDGLLAVAKSGDVEGDIHAPRIVIDGTVRGNVYASEHLELVSGAVIEGNVFYQVIEMAKGAQVNGGLKHYANGIPEQRSLPKQIPMNDSAKIAQD